MRRIQAFLLLLAGNLLFLSSAVSREYSALVVEPETGRVLYEKYAQELRHPASVTKMMTLYLVFEALERGDLTLNTPLDVSRNAVLRPPSRLGLSPGETIAVEDAVLGLVTRSANDVATVIAENLGGSESSFAAMMTAKARSLGMRDTVFRNASGLPDPDQVTTAWDMYRLGKALIEDFPRYYPYFSTPRFYYRGQSFDNHNHLMETYPGMDGIKTGFINSSGFNLVASAKQGGRRIIGVVFGGPSAKGRDSHMREILNDGFAQLDGLPPRQIEASFDRPATQLGRGRSFAELNADPPQLTFGNPKRFKSTATSTAVVSRRSASSASRSPMSVGSDSRKSPTGLRTAKEASTRSSSGSHKTYSKESSKLSSAKQSKTAISKPPTGDGTRSKSTTVKAAAHAKSSAGTPSSSACRGAKDKASKCKAK